MVEQSLRSLIKKLFEATTGLRLDNDGETA